MFVLVRREIVFQFAERIWSNNWMRHQSSCVCFMWGVLFSFFVWLCFCSEGKCSLVEKVIFYPREQCWPMVLLRRKVKHLLDNLPNVDLNYCRMNAPLLFSQWIKALKTFPSVSLLFSLPLFSFFSVNSSNANGFGLWISAWVIGRAQPLLSYADWLSIVLYSIYCYSIWKVQAVLNSSLCVGFPLNQFNISTFLENEDELCDLWRSNRSVHTCCLHCLRSSRLLVF